jgi:hypothetical protein
MGLSTCCLLLGEICDAFMRHLVNAAISKKFSNFRCWKSNNFLDFKYVTIIWNDISIPAEMGKEYLTNTNGIP